MEVASWWNDDGRLGNWMRSRFVPSQTPIQAHFDDNEGPQEFSPKGTTRRKRPSTSGRFPRDARPRRLRRSDHSNLRVTLLEGVAVWAWPSLGGVIVLEHAQGVDLEFLGFDPLDPPLHCLSDPAEEDAFCKRLLLLGATWWDSEYRRNMVKSAEESGRACELMGDGKIPGPRFRERRWVSVAWPSTGGGLWVSEFDRETGFMDSAEEEERDNMVPFDTGRVGMARTMDERVAVLQHYFAPKFYKNLEDYRGFGFINEWETRFMVD